MVRVVPEGTYGVVEKLDVPKDPDTTDAAREVQRRRSAAGLSTSTIVNIQKSDKIRSQRRTDKMRIYLNTRPEDEGIQLQRWRIAHFMNHWVIKSFLVFFIIANAVVIGVEADYGNGEWEWEVVEAVFLTVFTIELVLNLIGYGEMFFEDCWNWLDATIVVLCLADSVVQAASGGSSGTVLSVIRLIRILRIVRVVSFLEKLVYLVAAFLTGMQSVSWVMLLWVICLYMFAVLSKTFFGDSEHLKTELNGVVDIDEYFGTIPRCMVTLISFFTYDNTSTVQRAIGTVYPAAWIFFIGYMVLVSIGVMELITSIFIDSLLEEKKKMEASNLKEQQSRRREVQDIITGLFEAFDENGDAELNKEELMDCLAVFNDDATRQILVDVGFDPDSVKAAISVADIDGDGVVSAVEFSSALASIHASPKVSDLREIQQRVGHLAREVESHHNETNMRLMAIEELLTALATQMSSSNPDKPHAVAAAMTPIKELPSPSIKPKVPPIA